LLTSREECRLRVFETGMLRRIFGAKTLCFLIYLLMPLFKKIEVGRICSTYGGRGEVHMRCYWGNLREGDHLEDPGIY
jgi:hypothetical protein